MKTLISILAHGAAQETFERHFKFWEKPECDILIWCPTNDRVKAPGATIQAVSMASHHGPESCRRMIYIMEHLSKSGYDRHAFFEYDSICFGDLPELKAPIAGNQHNDPHTDQFKGGMFIQPPLLIDALALPLIVHEWRRIGPEAERGYWDRALGLVVKNTVLQWENYLGDSRGYSQNTIHPGHYPELRRHVLNGATMIHGLKDKQALDVAELAWRHRQMHEELKKAGDVIPVPSTAGTF